jgi:hypothetical protein
MIKLYIQYVLCYHPTRLGPLNVSSLTLLQKFVLLGLTNDLSSDEFNPVGNGRGPHGFLDNFDRI